MMAGRSIRPVLRKARSRLNSPFSAVTLEKATGKQGSDQIKKTRNVRCRNSFTIAAVPLLCITRKKESVVRKPKTSIPPTTPKTNPTTTDPIINLDDTKQLFSSVSTLKLIKSSLTLRMASTKSLVDLGLSVMDSPAMDNPILKKMVFGFTKRTFYDHFCGGEDLEGAARTVRNLWRAGLSAMLDYGLEHSNDNVSCDRNLEEFIRSINWTSSLDGDVCSVSFVVVKITAICPPILLKRVSDLLRWEYKDDDKSMNLPWKHRTLPIFSESSPIYHTLRRPLILTLEEERDLELAYQRLEKICERSLAANVPLLIDAEETSIQPAIDYFTYSAAISYKAGDNEPLIFNTIQAYLKDANERLVNTKKAADRMGVPVGFKLVRGAYMSMENRLARSLGEKSPIHETLESTHACYNHCAEFMLHEIAARKGSVVLATHNVQSGKLAALNASGFGIKRDNPHLQFAQLYGMAEALSFGLRNAGFKVSKYLPFGPVDQIMPYLLRRAEENRSLLTNSTTSHDRQLMRKELLRRIRLVGQA